MKTSLINVPVCKTSTSLAELDVPLGLSCRGEVFKTRCWLANRLAAHPHPTDFVEPLAALAPTYQMNGLRDPLPSLINRNQHFPVGKPNEQAKVIGMKQKRDVQQGTLSLMILKTLDVLGPLHGYGVARRIEQISGELLSVNQGTLYPVLLRLDQEGAITAEWGPSENNRRARFYALTLVGRKLLATEKRDWKQTAAIIARFFDVKAKDLV